MTLTEEWMLLAACRGKDPEIFFPDDAPGVAAASRLCQECQVRGACLEYALARGMDDGVWGGKSARARKSLRRGRRAAERALGGLPARQRRAS